jgi:hypothetical protein
MMLGPVSVYAQAPATPCTPNSVTGTTTTTSQRSWRCAGDGQSWLEILPLVSGQNIKTINGASVLGSGDLTVSGSGAAWGAITGTLADQSDLQTALDGKQASGSYLTTTGNGSGLTNLTKSQVGLGNVDNTSDAAKPVSTATQTALDAKQATLVSATNIKTVNGSSLLGSGNLAISGAGDTVLRLAGNVSTAANTTLVDLTGMSFTADAGGIYSIDIKAIAQSPVATTGYGLGINCAQTPVTVALGGASQLANTGTVTSWSSIANNAIVGVASGLPSAATNVPVHGGGVLVAHATNSGTCIFRLRSETTAVTTMMANSLFIVRKVN